VRRIKWANVAAIIGVLATIAGIWFSAWSAYQQSIQQDEAKAAAQLGLLTQLSSSARVAFAKINDTAVAVKACRGDHAEPTRSETAVIFEALGTFDYLAWLDNTGQMENLPSAERYWVRQTLAAWTIARLLYTPAVLDPRFPALAEYRAHLPRGTPASPVCS
jgi:type II secretory pathway pseudopilin PulG